MRRDGGVGGGATGGARSGQGRASQGKSQVKTSRGERAAVHGEKPSETSYISSVIRMRLIGAQWGPKAGARVTAGGLLGSLLCCARGLV